MAERRYGFRFSFAEGCIIVVSIVGASFLVFLFGVYAGRELEARKASEHTSTVRLAAVSDSAPASAGKEEPEKSPAASPAADKTKTVVIMSSPPPRPSGTANQPPANVELAPKPQAGATVGTVVKSTPVVSSVVPSGSHLSAPESAVDTKLGSTQSQTGRTLATPNTAAPLNTEEKKSVMQVMQAAKKESSSSFPAKPPASTPNAWSVQIQATRDYEGAQQMVRDLQSRGYAPTVSRVTRDGEIWYRIRVGSFASAEEAQSSVEHLRREGRFPRAYLVSN